MRIKYFLLILFLVLGVVLSGCGSVITPATDEAKIKSVINEYFLAINDQDFGKAKGYCVYGSDRYYATCQFEDGINTLYVYCDTVTINCYADILSVSVYGDYSEAYCYFSGLITACGYYDSDSKYGYYYLQKIGGSWKMYAP